jgi:hypothetical protein
VILSLREFYVVLRASFPVLPNTELLVIVIAIAIVIAVSIRFVRVEMTPDAIPLTGAAALRVPLSLVLVLARALVSLEMPYFER